MDYDTFVSMLGEGFHTAFRKAVDTRQAAAVHRLITEMPPADWAAVVEFVADPIAEALGIEPPGPAEATEGEHSWDEEEG